mmetsp:Transcript_36386/g.121841  ORF Transcript_36386/g.121841 Transcript_36386/m.121841 type:complete len:208 (-) Transcript_36386:100-723(-)
MRQRFPTGTAPRLRATRTRRRRPSARHRRARLRARARAQAGRSTSRCKGVTAQPCAPGRARRLCLRCDRPRCHAPRLRRRRPCPRRRRRPSRHRLSLRQSASLKRLSAFSLCLAATAPASATRTALAARAGRGSSRSRPPGATSTRPARRCSALPLPRADPSEGPSTSAGLLAPPPRPPRLRARPRPCSGSWGLPSICKPGGSPGRT